MSGAALDTESFAMFGRLMRTVHGSLVFERRARVIGRAVLEMLPRQGRVLDVGTGDGSIAQSWGSNVPGLIVEGIDVLVRPTTHIPVRGFDGLHIPYQDKSVDVVTLIDVVHHASDPRRLLAEVSRVARNAVIIKDHIARSRIDHLTLGLMDWVGNAPHGVPSPHRYFSWGEWLQHFRDAGLLLESINDKPALYPWPWTHLFGRRLHFIARLRPVTEISGY